MDVLTTVDGEIALGRVNVNTASKQVLEALPGISSEIAQKMISKRTQGGNEVSNIGWVIDVVDTRDLQQFFSMVTVRSDQFRIHAVGRLGTPYDQTVTGEEESVGRPRPFYRLVAIFDRIAQPKPRITYWKDLSHLGMAYVPDEGPGQLSNQ